MKFILLVLFGISIPSLVLSQRASSNAQQLCKSNRNTGLFQHEEFCDFYYQCDENGDAIVQSCPNGLAFAGARRGLVSNCDYPHRVGCPDGQRVMGQSPMTTENCHWQYGVFPHATSCTRYWHCWNGTATIQQCPFSLLYNDALHTCDWPSNVQDCQKHPICKDTPNGPVAIEKSCVRYWLCVGGYPRLQRCPAGLAVNPTSLKCELASTVAGCEPPPTTATTVEEEEEDNGQSFPQGSSQPSSQPNESNSRPSNTRPVTSSNSNSNSNSNPTPFRPPQGVRLVG